MKHREEPRLVLSPPPRTTGTGVKQVRLTKETQDICYIDTKMSSVSSCPLAPVGSVTTEVRVKAEEAGVSQGKPSDP